VASPAGYRTPGGEAKTGECTTHTVLTGPMDRSALYGVLAEVEALGLDLLEVRQRTPECESPGSGDNRSP
jgi:hypothetical protein